MANVATSENNELSITVEQPQAWARRLKITVPSGRVARQRQELTQRYARRVRLPGFRQGKVPAHVVEKKFGAALDQETLQKVIEDAYREALEREHFEPITQANVTNLEYKPGEDVKFEVDFEVRPQVELDRLGGFQLTRSKPAVGEAEVERVVARLREEQASWTAVEGEAPADGDMVAVEITPISDEGELQESKTRPYQIILGREEAAAEVEAAIRSLKPGDATEFTIAHTGEEGHEGHSHRARVMLKEVKHASYPELDDEFAARVGGFESMDALRARVRSDLEHEAEQDAETGVRRQLIERIVEANPFEVPESMVAQYLERLLPAREGANPERLAEARAGLRGGAEQAIKRMLVLERVAELEGLRATPSEIGARLEELAPRIGRPVAELRKQLQKDGQLHALEDELTEEKVFTYLKSLSTVE